MYVFDIIGQTYWIWMSAVEHVSTMRFDPGYKNRLIIGTKSGQLLDFNICKYHIILIDLLTLQTVVRVGNVCGGGKGIFS